MRNSAIIKAYLDSSAETIDAMRSNDVDRVSSVPELSDRSTELWQACLDDGWTREELDAIYGRRFGIDIAALRRQEPPR